MSRLATLVELGFLLPGTLALVLLCVAGGITLWLLDLLGCLLVEFELIYWDRPKLFVCVLFALSVGGNLALFPGVFVAVEFPTS